MEDIVATLHKQIVKPMPKSHRDKFNDIFRQMVALQSPSEILKGLTTHKKLVVIRDALAEFDTQMNSIDDLHVPVFNSVTKAVFNSLIATARLKSPEIHKSEVVNKPVKPETTDRPTAVSAIAGIEAKLQNVNITQKPVKPIASKPKQVAKPKGDKVQAVYNDLMAYLGSDVPMYGRVPYIDCKLTNCSFTRTLFQNVALTKCTGHKKCVASGWFPHVGITLWKSLASKHTHETIFSARSRKLKDNEMPSLAAHIAPVPSSSDMEEDYDSDASTSTVKTASSASRKRPSPSRDTAGKRSKTTSPIRTRSPAWCDDVDGLDLTCDTQRWVRSQTSI